MCTLLGLLGGLLLMGWLAFALFLWRREKEASGLFALEEHAAGGAPQVFDTANYRVLRDYVEVLHERQQRGE